MHVLQQNFGERVLDEEVNFDKNHAMMGTVPAIHCLRTWN
jgi:hypothetical protein